MREPIRENEFNIVINSPLLVGDEMWQRAQELEIAAFSAAMATPNSGRTTEDFERMFHADDFDAYVREHRNPKERFPDLEIKNSRFVGAFYLGKLVGTAYIDDESSGSERVRKLKMMDPFMFKRYARIAGVSVHPDYQGQEFGVMLTYAALRTRQPYQTVSTYFWDEHPYMRGVLNKYGVKIDEQPDSRPEVGTQYFGEDKPPVEQYRATIKAQKLMRRLKHNHPHAIKMLKYRLADIVP